MRLAVTLLIAPLLAVGCSGSDGVTADGGAGPASDSGSDSPIAPGSDGGASDAGFRGFCTNETPAITPSGAGVVATTTHYELYAETTPDEATELGRLLEAGGAAIAGWFERPLPAARMKVKYFRDAPSFLAGLAADAVSAPADAGGYYSPDTRTAYLYKQGNPYYSHVLLLHEATHQIHGLTRLAPQPVPFWYAEGHAEYLSRHDWDGRCATVGVMSVLSWEDLPAGALAEPGVDVGAIVSGKAAGSRADAWAMFRYLDTGANHAAFKAFRDAFDTNNTAAFSQLVAAPDTITAPLAAWLAGAQEPMKPVFTEWVHVGPAAVDVATPVYFSLALVKGAATHLESTFIVPASGTWTVGTIVSFTDAKHYTGVVHSSDGVVKTFTANGSAIWGNVGAAPAPAAAREAIAVDLSGGGATVTFNGKAFSFPQVSAPRVGLAASDTTGHFVDLAWK